MLRDAGVPQAYRTNISQTHTHTPHPRRMPAAPPEIPCTASLFLLAEPHLGPEGANSSCFRSSGFLPSDLSVVPSGLDASDFSRREM